MTCWAILRASLKNQSEQFGITGRIELTDILDRLENRADFVIESQFLNCKSGSTD